MNNISPLSEKLDKRMTVALSLARKGFVCADIGTDHGFLICQLVLDGTATKGYACDINEKPLQNAKSLVSELGLYEKIECVLSDGLEGLADRDIKEIFICGMGGETIAGIIERAPWTACEGVHLVLQPMTRANELRKWLCNNGYKIEEEKAVCENGHVYTVLSVYYDGIIKEPSEVYCILGELMRSETYEALEYILWQANLYADIAKEMKQSKANEEKAEYYFRLSEEIRKSMGALM